MLNTQYSRTSITQTNIIVLFSQYHSRGSKLCVVIESPEPLAFNFGRYHVMF